eukprot:scaffold12817_cov75-Phaeocystis_antarctica.AAC.5
MGQAHHQLKWGPTGHSATVRWACTHARTREKTHSSEGGLTPFRATVRRRALASRSRRASSRLAAVAARRVGVRSCESASTASSSKRSRCSCAQLGNWRPRLSATTHAPAPIQHPDAATAATV